MFGPSDFLPVSRPYVGEPEISAVVEALRKGEVSGRAAEVASFEHAFAKRVGAEYAVAVSSGTAAVHLALACVGVSAEDEVITADFAMAAPLFAICYCGARPVLVDADTSWNIDPSQIRHNISDRTRAILAVHTYGHPADMESICSLAEQLGVPVIEDAAEALGARAYGQLAGSFGDISCFSFYANKAVTTGEGGMLVTSSPDYYYRATSLRNMSFGPTDQNRFVHEHIGYSYRMSGLQAALGNAQLQRLEASVASSVAIARLYREELADVPGLVMPPELDWADSSYWVFGTLVTDGFGLSRNSLRSALASAGIETRSFFQAGHRQPFLNYPASDQDFPRASALADCGLYLPSFAGLDNSSIRRVCDFIRSVAATSE